MSDQRKWDVARSRPMNSQVGARAKGKSICRAGRRRLFGVTSSAHLHFPVTPDGRRDGDTVSYGVGPSSFASGKTATSALSAAARPANDRCACAHPLLLSLDRAVVQDKAGRKRLRQMVETYFRLGGFHVHAKTLNADLLREAQAHPEQHTDLLVRISGLSAQFTTLDERLQNGIIERTEGGL